MTIAPLFARLYRYCQWLYPPEYRDEYSLGMELLFNERMSDALHRRRAVALVIFFLREFASVIWTALSAQMTVRAGTRRRRLAERPVVPPAGRLGRSILDVVGQDFHHAIRVWMREPGFTVVAVFLVALGIGACTTVFSIVNAVLLRPLPYRAGLGLGDR